MAPKCKGQALFLLTLLDGFVIWAHLSYVLYIVIRQLRNSVYQLEIEIGRYARNHMEEQDLPIVLERRSALQHLMVGRWPLYKEPFLQMPQDVFIMTSSYIDIHLSRTLCM